MYLIPILKNKYDDIRIMHQTLVKQLDDTPANKDDKMLWTNIILALSDYKDYISKSEKLEDVVKVAAKKCAVNVSPMICSCFSDLLQTYDNPDIDTVYKIKESGTETTLYKMTEIIINASTYVLSGAADLGDHDKKSINAFVKGPIYTLTGATEKPEKSVVEAHTEYIGKLYKNTDLQDKLYRLYDDTTIVTMPDAGDKLIALLKQM